MLMELETADVPHIAAEHRITQLSGNATPNDREYTHQARAKSTSKEVRPSVL